MSQYRIYFLDSAGASYRNLPLDCADDAAALAEATTHAGPRALQLWCGARVLRAYPADPAGRRPAS